MSFKNIFDNWNPPWEFLKYSKLNFCLPNFKSRQQSKKRINWNAANRIYIYEYWIYTYMYFAAFIFIAIYREKKTNKYYKEANTKLVHTYTYMQNWPDKKKDDVFIYFHIFCFFPRSVRNVYKLADFVYNIHVCTYIVNRTSYRMCAHSAQSV